MIISYSKLCTLIRSTLFTKVNNNIMQYFALYKMVSVSEKGYDLR